MPWHFVTVFMLPFFVILVSNYLLISKVKASRKVTRMTNASLSGAASSSGNYSPFRQYHRGLARCIGSVNSLTAVIVVTSLFFCACLMPEFLVDVLIAGQVISQISLSQFTCTVLDQMVYLNCSCRFYLYCITGRSFRQELHRIYRRLLCRQITVLYSNQKMSLAPSETRCRPTSFTSSARRSPTLTPRSSTTNPKPESNPTASRRQVSPQAVRFENQSLSPHGQAESRSPLYSGTTLSHPCKTSPEPMPLTLSPSTAVNTPIQTGETVPSEQHAENLLESVTTLPHPCKTSSEPMPLTISPSTAEDTPIQTGETAPFEQHAENLLESETTLPHSCKTSSEPMPSTRSPNTDSPIQAGETVPSEQHRESLPLSELDIEAEGNATQPGKIVTLISALKTNSGDLSHCQDRDSESTEESS